MWFQNPVLSASLGELRVAGKGGASRIKELPFAMNTGSLLQSNR
jgi:hypothetical protein